VIDEIVMVILAFFVSLIFGGCAGLSLTAQSDFVSVLTGTAALITWASLFIFQFLYFEYFWSGSGRSVGMKLLNVNVVRRTQDEQLSFFRAAFRGTLGYAISALFFSPGFIWAAFGANKETWHDKIFDTWVVVS